MHLDNDFLHRVSCKYVIKYGTNKSLISILLLYLSAKQSDCSEKCRLTLLLIKQFPEAVKECAVSYCVTLSTYLSLYCAPKNSMFQALKCCSRDDKMIGLQYKILYFV